MRRFLFSPSKGENGAKTDGLLLSLVLSHGKFSLAHQSFIVPFTSAVALPHPNTPPAEFSFNLVQPYANDIHPPLLYRQPSKAKVPELVPTLGTP